LRASKEFILGVSFLPVSGTPAYLPAAKNDKWELSLFAGAQVKESLRRPDAEVSG
jgi:hypothetical protein